MLLIQTPALHKECNRDPVFVDQMLTAAVQVIDEGIPGNLQWQVVFSDSTRTPCFEAVAQNGTLYSINILTGVVLFDGLPPGRLPKSVIEDPLYERSFGDRNFEVRLAGGRFTSIKQKEGYHYHFFRDAHDALIIREEHEGVVLELMDADKIKEWGNTIPVRLQKMYSHWCCRNESTGEVETILFRGKRYCDRAVSFLLHRKTDTSTWVCACVPEHKKKHSWHEQLVKEIDDFDHLVLLTGHNSSPIVDLLHKFEPRRDCIHVIQRVPRQKVC